jgi:hypothetical protein
MNFNSVFLTKQKSGKCSKCGKTIVKQKKFEHTVNPFNKNEDGTVKSYSQVFKDVVKESNEWIPDFTHDRCK